jgi:hypothetical protein
MIGAAGINARASKLLEPISKTCGPAAPGGEMLEIPRNIPAEGGWATYLFFPKGFLGHGWRRLSDERLRPFQFVFQIITERRLDASFPSAIRMGLFLR